MKNGIGARASHQQVSGLAGDMFYFIAKAILVSTAALMTLLWALYIIVDYREAFEAELSTPGRTILRIESTGIYKLTLIRGGEAECQMLAMGRKPASLITPDQVWYGAVSSGSTLYLSHMDSPGVYNLQCASPAGPVALRYTKATAEMAVWLFAWMVILPVALMSSFIAMGWLYVRATMPDGGYTVYPTADESLIGQIKEERRRNVD